MSGPLVGRTAIITGASRGIGRAIADAFVAAGASVLVSARSANALDAVVASLRGRLVAGQQVEAATVDVADPHDIDALVARAVSLGLNHLPAGRQEHLAATEGWLHVPHPRTLEELTAPRP